MTSPSLAISARNLTLTLGSGASPVTILRGIDLDVPQGQVVALLGPSGSGKSSLMAVLSGLERASGGSLMVAGTDFTALDEDGLAAARRGRIGIVLQAFHLLPTMTAAENVATPMELAAMPDAAPRALAELEAVGLAHRTGHYPTQLSGGEQQRVAIARAVIARPKMLIADEPTGNVDPDMALKLLRLFEALNNRVGTTVVVATHDVHLLKKVPDSLIMRLRKGQLSDPTGALRYPPKPGGSSAA